MKKWTTFDPETGIKETEWASDDDNSLVIRKEEDVQGLLDRNMELRNSGVTDIGIKKGLWHVASIPMTVQYELLKKGININRREDLPRAYKEIEANYPYLKTTNKKHIPGTSTRRAHSPMPGISMKPGKLLIGR